LIHRCKAGGFRARGDLSGKVTAVFLMDDVKELIPSHLQLARTSRGELACSGSARLFFLARMAL
jgi:hypothetical protein